MSGSAVPVQRPADTPGAMAEHTVVVAAASRHGSTRQVTRRLAAVLTADLSDRWTVREADLSDLRVLEGADAVVLGSAIYMGHWLRAATQALHQVKDAPLLDLWLFSTGPVSGDAVENAAVITADKSVESGCATEHMVFAGSLDTSTLRWWERLVFNIVKAVPGDRRDWTLIDAWGHSIAAQLTHAVAKQEPDA